MPINTTSTQVVFKATDANGIAEDYVRTYRFLKMMTDSDRTWRELDNKCKASTHARIKSKLDATNLYKEGFGNEKRARRDRKKIILISKRIFKQILRNSQSRTV